MKIVKNLFFALLITESYSQSLKADINCDGKQEAILVTETEEVLSIYLQKKTSPDSISLFKNDEPLSDAFCGLPSEVAVEDLRLSDEEMKEMFGEVLEGYKKSGKCKGLVILNKCDTDKIHIYWNSKKKTLMFWRL